MNIRNILRFFSFLIIIIGIASKIGVWKISQIANSELLIKEETLFSIKAGTGRIALDKQLCREKVIDYPNYFRWLLRMKPELTHFKAGTYRFVPGMTVIEMLKLLASGKEAQFPIRLIEGMRLSDYLRQLRNAPYIRHTLDNDEYKTVAIALKLKDPEWIEGWFWPDTWMYTANTTDIALLERAHKKMVNMVEKVWQKRAKGLPYKDQNQLVTMASIIEKETSIIAERDYVASVLVNRLRFDMRLQADPTVIYGMGCKYSGKISRKDLETPTKYNTYLINGLPPSPIAIPGQASLNAAAHPAETPYLYFVADGNGGHVFNTNLSSHNHSVQNYLKVLKKKNA